jgi:hypothetical protein
MEEKRNDDIVELNTTEAEQVVGGKMVRAPVHPAGELNTINHNSGAVEFHEHAMKK